MKSRIWKFDVPIQGVSLVEMPASATLLSVKFQGGVLRAWAIVSPDNPPGVRVFHIYGTGHEVSESPGQFIATVGEGIFIWHVFDAGWAA